MALERKKRLAIITTWYPPVNGSFVQQQAEALSEFYDVSVFVAYFSFIPKKEVNVENDVKVHRFYFPHLPKRSFLTMKYWIAEFTNRISREISEVDIIHAHNYLGGTVAHHLSRRLNRKFYVTLHATNFMKRVVPSVVKPFVKTSLTNAEKVICVGKSLQEIVVEDYELTNTVVIGNMVDTSLFIPKLLPYEPFKFLMVAYFNERKGGREVIEAFQKMNHPNVELMLIGECDATHENYFNSRNDTRIKRIGKMDTSDIPEYMANSHCLISFSTIETFGITVIEAMSCGIPILFCESGGPEHFVPDWAGIKVKRNIPDLMQGMETMIKRYHAFDRAKIREYVKDSFDNLVIVRELMDVYKD